MKKLISFIAAIAMMSSLFVSTAFAELPSTAQLSFSVETADADQMETYEGNVDPATEPGYTLYVISFSQTGLGEWRNTNTSNKNAQLTRPTGWLPGAIEIDLDFGSDVANVYEDTENGFFVDSKYNLNATLDGNVLKLIFGPWSSSSGAYPLNGQGTLSIAEGDTFAELYLEVKDSATATFGDKTEISMCQYSVGAQTELENKDVKAAYKKGSTLTFSESAVEFGASGGSANFSAIGSGDVSEQNLTDLSGNPVEELSANYGITKITTEELDLVNKRYFLLVTDDEGETNEDTGNPFEINFGAGDEDSVYETSGEVSFYALVKSTSHIIKSIALKVVDR